MNIRVMCAGCRAIYTTSIESFDAQTCRCPVCRCTQARRLDPPNNACNLHPDGCPKDAHKGALADHDDESGERAPWEKGSDWWRHRGSP